MEAYQIENEIADQKKVVRSCFNFYGMNLNDEGVSDLVWCCRVSIELDGSV